MNVKYLRDVRCPPQQAGKKGEVKELPEETAQILLKGGYVEEVTKNFKERTDDDSDKGTNSKSQRH